VPLTLKPLGPACVSRVYPPPPARATAKCVASAISPLQIGDEVDVVGMAPEEECLHEMFVLMRWERDGLAVPLSQLAVTYADDVTQQAVEDWLYWVDRGYQF
jgi:Calcium binding